MVGYDISKKILYSLIFFIFITFTVSCGDSGDKEELDKYANILFGIGNTSTTNAPPTTSPMVYIPAGWFWMGCSPNDNQCKDSEKPYHKVYLDAYYIDLNDVTVDEYNKCVNAGGCTQLDVNDCLIWNGSSRVKGGSLGAEFQKGNHPVVCVDWNQANSYCQWAGKRLPTEAEWEKAARGTDGRIYPWGNEWDASKACYNQSSTCAVGSYPQGASPYGVLDMAGNVWNWCRDWYDANYYANSPDHNPTGPDSGSIHVLRGGSFNNLEGMRSSYRSDYYFTNGYDDRGFRCAR